MASDANPARVAVIGLGHWGPNLARNFAAAEGACLTALCDLDEAALAAQLARYPEARGTTRRQIEHWMDRTAPLHATSPK